MLKKVLKVLTICDCPLSITIRHFYARVQKVQEHLYFSTYFSHSLYLLSLSLSLSLSLFIYLPICLSQSPIYSPYVSLYCLSIYLFLFLFSPSAIFLAFFFCSLILPCISPICYCKSLLFLNQQPPIPFSDIFFCFPLPLPPLVCLFFFLSLLIGVSYFSSLFLNIFYFNSQPLSQ